MQLAESKALGVFHHHDDCVGYIHTDLNDGGGHQQLDFTSGKSGHDGFTFLRAHFAVQHTHLIALKGSAGKGVGVFLCILQVGWGIFHRLHQRADDVPLQAAVQMVLQKAVGAQL